MFHRLGLLQNHYVVVVLMLAIILHYKNKHRWSIKMRMMLEYFAKQSRKNLFLLLANLHFQINNSSIIFNGDKNNLHVPFT